MTLLEDDDEKQAIRRAAIVLETLLLQAQGCVGVHVRMIVRIPKILMGVVLSDVLTGRPKD
jgi:hypothetical protein